MMFLLPLRLIFAFTLVLLGQAFTFVQVVVTSTQYTFTAPRYQYAANFSSTPWNTSAIPPGANISIQFPIQYTPALLAQATLQSLVLTTDTGTITATVLPSLITNNLQITIPNLFSNPTFVHDATIVLGNLLNPQPAIKTSSFVIKIGQDISFTSTSGGTLLSHMQLTPGTLASCSAVFSSGLLNRLDNLTITLSSLTTLTANSIVKVTFPASYARDPTATSIISSSSMTCITSLSTLGLTCDATIANHTVNIYQSLAVGGSLGTTFQINDIMVPPSVQQADTLNISTYTNGLISIDSCLTVLGNLNSIPLTGLTATYNQIATVNAPLTVTYTIPLNNPVYTTDYILITFSLLYLPPYTLVALSSLYNNTNLALTLHSTTPNSLNLSANTDLNTGTTLFLTLNTLHAPPAIDFTLTTDISIYQLGNLKATGSHTLRPTPNIIPVTNIQLSPGSTTILTSNTYTLWHINPDPLTASSMMIITFPSQIPLGNTISSVTFDGNSVSLSITGNSLILTSLPVTVANSNITILIQTIKNPAIVDALSTNLTLTTYYSNNTNSVMNYANYLPTFTFTSASSLQFSVTTSSLIVNSPNTTWNFYIQTQASVPPLGILKILLPNSLAPTLNLSTIPCPLLDTLNNLTISLQCTVSTDLLNNLQLSTGPLPSAVGTQLVLTLQNSMQNPLSTQPIYNFSIITYSALGNQLQRSSLTSPTFLTINIPQPFISFKVIRNSTRNSQYTSYSFQLEQQSIFSTANTQTNIVEVSLPTQLSLTKCSCVVCLLCPSSNASNIVRLTLDNTLIAGLSTLNFIFQMNNFHSLQPLSSNISATTILNNIYNYSHSAYPHNHLTLTNSQPATLTITQTIFFTTELGRANSLTLTIDRTLTHAQYYIITLAPQFNIVNLTCTFPNSTLWTCSAGQLPNMLIISPNPTDNSPSLSIIINNFHNPLVYPSSPLQSFLSGYSTTNYLVDSYTGTLLDWQPICSFPCRTCSPNSTSCTTCYIDPQITNFKLFNPNTLQCLSACLSSQIALPNNTCSDCHFSCLQCSLSSANCTSCSSGSNTPYFYNNSCLAASGCPLFFYASPTFECLPCSAPCLACNLSHCLTCTNTTYFNIATSQCLAVCYNGTFPNSVNLTCDGCDTLCNSCSTSPTNCTSCVSPTPILFGSTCLSTCTPPLLALGSQCVASCQSPCLTCQTFASFCLSCITTIPELYLHVGSCLSFCPVYFAKTPSTLSCSSCSSLNLNCNNCQNNLNCSNFSTSGNISCASNQYYSCLVCDANFYLYYNATLGINQCLTLAAIPDGLVGVNGATQLCSTQCIKCSLLPNNCTSCSTLNYLQGQCLTNCPSGYFSNTTTITFNTANLTSLQCDPCPSQCLTCNSFTICPTCNNGFYLNGSYCVASTSCPPLTYPQASLNNCSTCISPCLDCNSKNNCTSCIASHYLLSGTCHSPNCPSGYYISTTNNICLLCLSPCLTCSDTTTCFSCDSNSNTYLYPYNNTCLTACPIGFFQDTLSLLCSNCSLPCLECDSLSCFRCIPTYNNISYYLLSGFCSTTCPSDTFANLNDPANPSCTSCSIQCTTCITSSTNCSQCNTAGGYKALSNSSSTCVALCPSTQIVEKVVGNTIVCNPCSDPLCLTCSYLDKCQVCRNNTHVLISGTCQINCPIGKIKAFNASINSSYCYIDVTFIPGYTPPSEPEGLTLQLPFQFPSSTLSAILIFTAIIIYIYQACDSDNHKIIIFPLLSAAMAIPQIAAFSISTGAYFLLRYKVFLIGPQNWDVFISFYCLCLLLTVASGCYLFILQAKILWEDSVYLKWTRQANCFQKLFQYAVNIITLFDFKISHIFWSGIKSMPILQNPQKLTFFNKPSAFGILVALAFIITSGLNLSYHPQLQYIYIDSIIVVSLSAMFSLLALRRPKNFFIHQFDSDPQLPMNKRVASSSDYFIVSGMSPSNGQQHFDSKLKKKEWDVGKDIDEQSLSSSSSVRSLSLTSRLSITPSVHMQNLSLQCTVMQDHQLNSVSQDGWSSTDKIPSVWCQSPSRSNYQVFQRSAEPIQDVGALPVNNYIIQQGSQFIQQIPTNLGMLEQGQESSFSAEQNEQNINKFVLPLQFRRYNFQQQAQHNYSLQLQKQEQKSQQPKIQTYSQGFNQYDLDLYSEDVSLQVKMNPSQKEKSESQDKKQDDDWLQQKDKSMSASINSKQAQHAQSAVNIIVSEEKYSNLNSNDPSYLQNRVSGVHEAGNKQYLINQSQEMNYNQSIHSIDSNIPGTTNRPFKKTVEDSMIGQFEGSSIVQPVHTLILHKGTSRNISSDRQIHKYGLRIEEVSELDRGEQLDCMNVSDEEEIQINDEEELYQNDEEVQNDEKERSSLSDNRVNSDYSQNLSKSSRLSSKSMKYSKMQSLRMSRNEQRDSVRSSSRQRSVKSSIKGSMLSGQSIKIQNNFNRSRQSNPSLKRSSRSLKKSNHSISQKMKSSLRPGAKFEEEMEREIIEESAESVDLSEYENRQHGKEKEGNQFRIKTVKKKKRKDRKQKQILLLVDGKKYRVLKSEAKMLDRQIKANEKIKKTINLQTEDIYKPQRHLQPQVRTSGSKERPRGSLTKQQKVYLNKGSPPKLQPGEQALRQGHQ